MKSANKNYDDAVVIVIVVIDNCDDDDIFVEVQLIRKLHCLLPTNAFIHGRDDDHDGDYDGDDDDYDDYDDDHDHDHFGEGDGDEYGDGDGDEYEDTDANYIDLGKGAPSRGLGRFWVGYQKVIL